MKRNKRTAVLQECVVKIDLQTAVQNIEHVWKGPPGNRSMSAISVIEMSSRSVRETALKKITEDNSILESAGIGDIACARAKTSMQLKRNGSLQKVQERLKNEVRCAGKSIEICWKTEGSKDRGVKVDGRMVFLQNPKEITGSFLAPLQDLSV